MSLAGRIPLWVDALGVVVGKLAASAFVLSAGFRAVSDDDYSRIVIAQRFAEAPRLDPSGTSWLPFPFWVHGTAHALFGPGLEVARATALALGACSVLLVWWAARILGAPRGACVLGALAAGLFPYSAWLGAAAVPEAISAGLLLFALSTLAQPALRLRLAAALALSLACFSRYEAWPVALVFAGLTLSDARRQRALVAPAVLGLSAPALWLLHGAFVHDNALFFVQRVTAYRAALGGAEESWLERLVWYPLALLRCEPELIALAVVALVAARLLRLGPELSSYRRVFIGLSFLLLFLVAGALQGGAPTHHAERALLPIWFGLALLSANVLWRAWQLSARRARLVLVLAAGFELVGGLLLRPLVTLREPFSARDAELEIGREARLQGVPRLLVASDDYGYFAVIASFGRPSRAEPLISRDPRRRPEPDALASAELLQESLARHRSRWLVAPRRYEAVARQVGRIAARNRDFVLLEAGR